MAKSCPKIFIDTNMLKFSVDRLERLLRTEQNINWGGKGFSVNVHVPVSILPNERIINDHLKAEVKLLPSVAKLVFDKQIELMIQEEVLIESWGQLNMDDQRGRFFGAPITKVEAPVRYGRIISSGIGSQSLKDLQVNFLKSLTDTRFKQLQKACGAYQGKNPPTPNQLIDAFHVWCAESARADYFLTCDLNLVNQARRHKRFPPKLQIVKPSELLIKIEAG